MSDSKLIWLSVVAAMVLAAVIVLGCTGTGKPSPQPLLTADKGVSFSPKSMDKTGVDDFFARARQAGGIVTWAGDWDDFSREGSGADFVVSQTSERGLIAVAEPQFFTQSTGEPLRPLDEATTKKYADSAADFVTAHKLRYLGLGIEVNVLHEKSPEDFEKFAKLFAETAAAVKKKSPDTKVFTVFQLERMKGLNGGLFGGVNDPAAADWALIDRFPGADLIAFTTYPGLIYKDPADIPADYYSEIGNRTNKPVAFTEIGWQSEAWPAGWESSEAEQAAFVTRFSELTGSLNPEMAIWSFVYDQATQKPFDSMGLCYANGSEKAAWHAWTTGS